MRKQSNQKNAEDLLSAIDAASANAYGSGDGALSESRAIAIDMYLGRNIDPADEGRCQAISRDVFDTIEWIKPSLLKVFTGQEEVVKFEPESAQDEESAAQETDYINYVVTRRNNWFQICNDWFTDALLCKNGYAMVYWDDTDQVETETYKGLSGVAIVKLQEDGAEIIEHKEYIDDSEIEAFQQQQQQLQAHIAQAEQAAMAGDVQAQQALPVLQEQFAQMTPPLLHDVKVKFTRSDGFAKICVLPPERCKISHGAKSYLMDGCDYFEYWESKTISELRSMGFDVPNDIGSDDIDNTAINGDSAESFARDLYAENVDYDDSDIELDPSMRKVIARMIWIRFDSDGDGIAEMQYVVRVGQEILFQEQCARIPISSISPIPVPHRHIGMSVADITIDIQDIKTEVLRQGIDNLRLSNNTRLVIGNGVNLDDVLVSRPNAPIRTTGIPGDTVMPLQTPFVFPQAMQGLEYLDQVKENRTGTSRYFTGIDQNSLNKTASGVKTLSSAAAQRVEQISRIFTPGVEELFSIVHEVILRNATKKDVVKLRGKWVDVDPREWKKRTNYSISVGVNAGNAEIALGQLRMILEAQREAIQIGVASPQNIYNTLVETTKLAGFINPDKFWTDPSKAPPQQQKIDQEQIKKQMDDLNRLSEQIKKQEIDLYKAKLDLEAKTATSSAKIDTQEQQAMIGLQQKHDEILLEVRRLIADYELRINTLINSPSQDNQESQRTEVDGAAQEENDNNEKLVIAAQMHNDLMAQIANLISVLAAPKVGTLPDGRQVMIASANG